MFHIGVLRFAKKMVYLICFISLQFTYDSNRAEIFARIDRNGIPLLKITLSYVKNYNAWNIISCGACH